MSFPCDEYNSIFKEKTNLLQHMKNCHGLKKCKCIFCNYHLNDCKSLKAHERSKHTHAFYNCLQCDFKYAQKDILKRHIRAIHDEKTKKV